VLQVDVQIPSGVSGTVPLQLKVGKRDYVKRPLREIRRDLVRRDKRCGIGYRSDTAIELFVSDNSIGAFTAR
jgi:hypothetical protein